MGYSSLFAYLTELHGYSAASAQRRIDGARLLIELPEISGLIETGKINLTQVSLLQQYSREAKRVNQNKISSETKKEVLLKLQRKSKSESQIIVSKAFELPIQEISTTRHQADESVRVEMTFTKAQWEKILQMQQVLSNAVNSADLSAAINYLAEKVIQKKYGKSKRVDSVQEQTTSAAEVAQARRTYITIQAQRQVFSKFPHCQYKNPDTGKVCGQKHFLQIEHIKPIWAGGGNEISNLTVLCANHNRYTYRRQSGISR
jgi:hypothetical protein